jgi:transposase
MRRTEVLQGLRRMRFEDVWGRWQGRQLSQAEAAEILGMSERTFRRWRERYEGEGAAGLLDRRLGKASARRVAADEVERVLTLYRERYGGFTARHFHDKLCRHHGFTLSYSWTRLRLQDAGLIKKARRRSAHRKKRPRRPLAGMLLHQDGSPHRWLAALDQQLDLIVTMERHERDLFGLPGRGGRDAEQLSGARRGDPRPTACPVRSTPTAAAITSTPPRRGRRSPGISRPRSGGRSPSSGSSTSRRTHPRRGGARSARSARSRIACPKSSSSLASPRWRRPTGSCARSTCPSTTPASQLRPSRREVRSSAILPASIGRSCACTRSASSATTTPCATGA